MQDRWYYRLDNKEIGPVSFADLLALAQQNSDFVTATVREDSSRVWLPAANLQALWPGEDTSGKREIVPIPGPKPISIPGPEPEPEPSDKTPLADFFLQACDAARRIGGATFAWLHQVLLYLFLRAERIGLRRRVRQSKSRFGEALCLVDHGASELRQQIKALEDQADSHPGGNRLDPRHWRERQKLLISLAETSLPEETVPEEARSDQVAVMEAVAALETNEKKFAEVDIGSGPLIVTGIVSIIVSIVVAANSARALGHEPTEGSLPPNFIIILCDNLGYGDIGCFGSTVHRTPNIDRLAAEGTRLTSFYVTSGVCTPSRASLMTGCYPRRVNMHVDPRGGAVLRPVSTKGLHPDEVTIAEVLKTRGYTTACIGKWHLGDQTPFLPTRQGFDLYYGIPYSDDMTARPGTHSPPLPLMENERVVEAPADRNTLTQRYTQRAIALIKAHRDKPFFLYLPHAMPGSTQRPYASEAFQGKSANGPYGDSVEEIDFSTGEILKTLREEGLDERTLVIWTSDNGAPRRSPPQGSNKPLGGWGYTTMEGGMRVPTIVRWTGHIPRGRVCDEIATTMDLLPTFAKLAGARLPPQRKIDGHDIRSLLLGDEGAKSPYRAFFYYHKSQLHAVRSDKWKLHLANERKIVGLGNQRRAAKAELYNLDEDLGETKNLADEFPDVVDRLSKLAEQARAELGDDQRKGFGQRPAGFVKDPHPQIMATPTEGNDR